MATRGADGGRSGLSTGPRVPVGVVWVLTCLALAAGPAVAQSGGLAVRVHDAESGEALAGATITLSNAQGLLATTAERTDADGRALFPVLRAGSGYAVEVALTGFAGRRMAEIRIDSGQVVEIVFSLTPGLEERVTAVEERRLVDVDRVGTATRFTDEFIENLPVPGRFYQNTLTLAPGVNDADGDGNPNVHGARSRDFKASVGGVSNVDPLTGQWLSYINPETIEVMDVITSGAGVEFGRAQGGFARIVQKQGTNRFEGVASFIYRSSKLDDTGANDGIAEGLAPEFTWTQPSIQVSGPIVKDKLWYRLSHEWIDREEPVDTIGTLIPTRKEQKIFADQITWQVSPRNKLAFQWQYDPLTFEGIDLSSTVPLGSTRTLERGGPTYSVTWTAPQSPRLLAETVVAYQDHFQNLIPTDADSRQDCVSFPYYRYPKLNDAYCLRSMRGRTSGAFPESSRDKRQRLTVHGKVTWHVGRALGAVHRVTMGLISENERYTRELERGPEIIDIDPFVIYAPPTAFCPGCPVPKAIVTVRTPIPRESKGTTTGTNWAVYVEDQIKPLDNLTFTLGLRWDREEIDGKGTQPFDPAAEAEVFDTLRELGVQQLDSFRDAFTAFADIESFRTQLADVIGVEPASNLPIGSGAIQSAFWPNKQRLGDIQIRNSHLSPRLSAAWDPWSRGKTKFALSAGRYYDKIFLAVPLIELEPLTTNLVFDADGEFIGNSAWGPVFGDDISVNELLVPLNPAIGTQLVDRDLRTPYQDEFTLSVEQELWPETSARISWIHREFRDQLQDIDINHTTGDLGRCIVATELGEPTMFPSDGDGFFLLDPYSGEVYEDTDPGPGDGRVDDCTGRIRNESEGLYWAEVKRVPEPDGLPDLYVLNPGWGEVLLLGNFNSTDYDAVVAEITRRFHRNWELQASYTWSQAEGDGEDYNQTQGNQRNLVEQEYGVLSFDQRHVAQVNFVTFTPWWGLRLGAGIRWESGLPYSLLEPALSVNGSPPDYGNLAQSRDVRFRFFYPTGQRNDQRNPSFWTVDARIAKQIRVSRRVDIQLTGEVFNLLNDDTLSLAQSVQGVQTGTRRFGRRFQLGLRVGF